MTGRHSRFRRHRMTFRKSRIEIKCTTHRKTKENREDLCLSSSSSSSSCNCQANPELCFNRNENGRCEILFNGPDVANRRRVKIEQIKTRKYHQFTCETMMRRKVSPRAIICHRKLASQMRDASTPRLGDATAIHNHYDSNYNVAWLRFP